MSISSTLDGCLCSKGCLYEVIRHPHTHTSTETAQSAHVPDDCLAKTLLFEDKLGYVAAMLSSTYYPHLPELQKETGHLDLTLVDESELCEVFRDYDAGAVPLVGMAYGMPTYIDSSLMAHGDIYLEAGDHENVVYMDMDQFVVSMRDAKPGRFAYRMQGMLFRGLAMADDVAITTYNNGLYHIRGTFRVATQGGRELIAEEGQVWLCHCGYSLNKSFCGGSHKYVKSDSNLGAPVSNAPA